MKVTKLIIGIVSMVMFLIVTFQSCAAGIGNALEENGEVSGSAGFLLAIMLLIAGIVGVSTRKGGKGASITVAIFYLIGGIIGIANAGSYSDLVIWSVISFIFAVIYLISAFLPIKDKQERSIENTKKD